MYNCPTLRRGTIIVGPNLYLAINQRQYSYSYHWVRDGTFEAEFVILSFVVGQYDKVSSSPPKKVFEMDGYYTTFNSANIIAYGNLYWVIVLGWFRLA